MSNQWLSKRRNFFVCKMVKEFIGTSFYFNHLYHNFFTIKALSYEDIAKWVGSENKKGVLWRLKDSSHQLWREPGDNPDHNANILDWVLGSIFHEAMKLKENIYMVQYYGPLVAGMNSQKGSSVSKQFWAEGRRLINKTEKGITEQMENLGGLWGHANYLVRAMMPSRAHNNLLVRFLIENESAVEQLWGEELNELLREMFPAGPEYAYCSAGKSYLEGHWYESAIKAYSTALNLNEGCEEARKEIQNLKTKMQQRRDQQLKAKGET